MKIFKKNSKEFFVNLTIFHENHWKILKYLQINLEKYIEFLKTFKDNFEDILKIT